jgi:NAD(P)H-hydrate epimerase
LVVAGSRGMSGAAFLASKACLRTGAGLVTVACPTSVNAVLEVKTTCVMTRPLPETPEGTLGADALEALRGLVPGRDALAVGPGLSRHPQTAATVREFLSELGSDGPLAVVDADGLNAFEGRADALASLAGRAVLTPHPGEFRRLSGCSKQDLADGREELVLAFAAKTGVVTLLKGHRTLIAAPNGALAVNETGNPGMATAGSGDVLTGVIACLLAQGLTPYDAARLGARLHGLAGDAAARRTGWAALIATDILDALVEVLCAEEARQ